tara:strand:+ start:1385 stop:1621 length:237 start_codon:yes stop_codon:yes gene_type:complete
MLSGSANSDLSDIGAISGTHQTRMKKIMSVGWLGQTVASLCWILSVFAYGISTTGDWLQLFAASSWMMSNIATIFSIE